MPSTLLFFPKITLTPRAFCGSILFDRIDFVDLGYYGHFNINSSKPQAQNGFPLICVLFGFFHQCCIVVFRAQVRKGFPDIRQNEREIKFIRVGDAVGAVGQLEGKVMLNGGP